MLTPALPPQAVPAYGSFDYVNVDPQRRRVYAAHKSSGALLIVDADSGKVLGQVRVGPMAGSAIDPVTGHVFTGNGDGDSVSEVDPQAMTIVRTIAVDGPVDAIAYDPENGHIYANEDDGTRMFVIDAKTLTLIKTIVLPGHKPEYLTIDPETHAVYQNIDTLAEIVVIDPGSLTIERTIPTPELAHNHPLQYDPAFRQIVVAGTNGVMSAYTRDGHKLGSLDVPRFDQCSLDRGEHVLACAGSGSIVRFRLRDGAAPEIIDTTAVDPNARSVAIDPSTHAVFTVWSNTDGSGDYVEKLVPAP